MVNRDFQRSLVSLQHPRTFFLFWLFGKRWNVQVAQHWVVVGFSIWPPSAVAEYILHLHVRPRVPDVEASPLFHVNQVKAVAIGVGWPTPHDGVCGDHMRVC